MGPQNESDSIPAIHAALDLGLNWIDAAASTDLVTRNKSSHRRCGGADRASVSSPSANAFETAEIEDAFEHEDIT